MKNQLFFKRIVTMILVILPVISTWCYASPLRVVILAPIDTSNYQEPRLRQFILYEIKKHFITPEYDVALDIQTSNAVQAVHNDRLTILPDQELMQKLADSLTADIVIAPQIVQADISRFSARFRDFDYQVKKIRLTAAVYFAQDQSYHTYHFSRRKVAGIEGLAGMQQLSRDCINSFMKKLRPLL